MTEFEDKNDFTVKPASRRTSSYNAVLADIFCHLAEYDRSIHQISVLSESLNALQTRIDSFEERWDRTEKELNCLKDKDDQIDRLKDELFCLKQRVDIHSADSLSVEDEYEKR